MRHSRFHKFRFQQKHLRPQSRSHPRKISFVLRIEIGVNAIANQSREADEDLAKFFAGHALYRESAHNSNGSSGLGSFRHYRFGNSLTELDVLVNIAKAVFSKNAISRFICFETLFQFPRLLNSDRSHCSSMTRIQLVSRARSV